MKRYGLRLDLGKEIEPDTSAALLLLQVLAQRDLPGLHSTCSQYLRLWLGLSAVFNVHPLFFGSTKVIAGFHQRRIANHMSLP